MTLTSPAAQSRLKRDHANGFSLVELLVVIAIVAVLLAIIMPSLRQAREVANAAGCASNLRQLGIAMNVYTQDERDGALPWTGRWSSGWGVRMTPYLGNPYTTALNGNPDDNSYFGPLFRNYSVFRCPTNLKLVGPNYYNYNYGYNARLAAGVTSGNAAQQALAWKDRRTLPQIIQISPSRIVMMADLDYNNFLSLAYLTSNVNDTVNGRVHFVKKLNLAFLDGHVQLLQEDQDNTLYFVDGRSQYNSAGTPNGW